MAPVAALGRARGLPFQRRLCLPAFARRSALLRLVMWWNAPAGQPFRVESSADLREWRTELVTIDYAAGRYRAILPWDAASNARFYRVVWTAPEQVR